MHSMHVCILLYTVLKQAVTSEVNALGGVSLKVALPCVFYALEECLQTIGLDLPPGPLTALYHIEV